MAQITYCRRSQEDVETSVSCTRCSDPICPSCMVHAPVGRPLPGLRTLEADSHVRCFYALSIAGDWRGRRGGRAREGAVISGIIWFLPLPYFISAILIAALGYGIGGIHQSCYKPEARNAPETGIGRVYVARLHYNHMGNGGDLSSDQLDSGSDRVLSGAR